MSNTTREIILTYSDFVEMFEPEKDFSGYQDDENISLLISDIKVRNPSRRDTYSAFLWKPSSEVYTGKWIRVEYNTSSSFAFWWCDASDQN